MKILVANISATEKNSDTGRFLQDVMGSLQLKNMKLTAQKDDKFVSRFPVTGLTHPDFAGNRYVTSVNLGSVFHQAVQAEKEGFDAVIIACVFDPCLFEARRAVNIPVAGLCESSLAMASMVGSKFGLISPIPGLDEPLTELITAYGMKDKVVGMRTMTVPWPEQELAYFNGREVIDDFRRIAEELIKEGADVLVPLCGLLSPIVRMAPGLQKEYPNGIPEINGVPCIDVMGSAMPMLRALSAVKQAGSGWHNPHAYQDKVRPVDSMGGPSSKIPEFWDL